MLRLDLTNLKLNIKCRNQRIIYTNSYLPSGHLNQFYSLKIIFDCIPKSDLKKNQKQYMFSSKESESRIRLGNQCLLDYSNLLKIILQINTKASRYNYSLSILCLQFCLNPKSKFAKKIVYIVKIYLHLK